VDNETMVSNDYKPGDNRFTGKIIKVTIDTTPSNFERSRQEKCRSRRSRGGNDRGLIATEFYDESASSQAALLKKAHETPYAPDAGVWRDHSANRSAGVLRRRTISANCCQQEVAARQSRQGMSDPVSQTIPCGALGGGDFLLATVG